MVTRHGVPVAAFGVALRSRESLHRPSRRCAPAQSADRARVELLSAVYPAYALC